MKGVERRMRSFDFDEHATAVVADEAGQSQPQSQSVDEGPEADALYDAPHRKPPSSSRARGVRGMFEVGPLF